MEWYLKRLKFKKQNKKTLPTKNTKFTENIVQKWKQNKNFFRHTKTKRIHCYSQKCKLTLNINPSSLSRGKIVYQLLYLKIPGVFWLQAWVNEGHQTVPSRWTPLFLSTFLCVGLLVLNKLLSMCSKDDPRILISACATSEKNKNLSPPYAFCSFKRLCLTLLGHLFTLGTKEVLLTG